MRVHPNQLAMSYAYAPRYVVCFSGGHSSALVAIETVRRYGRDGVVLLNHDINARVEDETIKRFKREVSEFLGIPITYANHPKWETWVVPGTVAQQPPDARAAIEARADDVVELGAGNLRTAEAYHARDRMMCHRASRVLAFLDGRRESSGSRQCAEYARMMGRPVTAVGLQGRR